MEGKRGENLRFSPLFNKKNNSRSLFKNRESKNFMSVFEIKETL